MLRISAFIGIFIFYYKYGSVSGHAFLAEPPARSSAWLFDKEFEKCCTYYNHNQMYCGGIDMLWSKFGGKCGICGEAWNETKQFEKGGSMYLGKILRHYPIGEPFNVTVMITANHNGFFEFRLCNVDNLIGDANQECLNKTLLRVKNTNTTKFYVHTYPSYASVTYTLDLPAKFTCDHCVLQMKYVTANRWGTDDTTNESCVGCGVIQEQFFGCADISIRENIDEIENNKEGNAEVIIESMTNEIKEVQNKNQTLIETNCKSILEFGKTLDISTIVTIYCNRVCNGVCKLPLKYNTQVCDKTCPLLCDCK